jgi:hypothetical protein
VVKSHTLNHPKKNNATNLIMAKQARSTNKPTHEETALRAYLIWEQSGRQPDQEMANWLKAETELGAARQEDAGKGKTERPAARI